jgi:flagellar assembly protein FliH
MSEGLPLDERGQAYHRWDIPDFGAREAVAPLAQLPTVAQLEAIQEQARTEGYQAGLEAGARDAAREVQRLQQLVSSMQNALQDADQHIAEELLGLALEVARKMLHQALGAKPELLLPAIREAISQLPHFYQNPHLMLHPDDVPLVHEKMGDQLSRSGWKIIGDPEIERGGLRIETEHSQVDATLEARWKRVISTIGVDHSWLSDS